MTTPSTEVEIVGARALQPVIVDHVARHLGLERRRGVGNGGNGVGGAARADGARAERGRSGIAVPHAHVVWMNPECVCGDLRHRGLVALALRRIAFVDRHLAARVDAHGDDAVAGLVFQGHQHVRWNPGELGTAGETDSEVMPFGTGLLLQRAKAGEIDLVQQCVSHAFT